MICEEEWLERVYYGGDLPREAERCLHQAALAYRRGEEAEGHLQEALRHAPGHIAVYIGLYKYYFYQGRLSNALEYARRCLQAAAAQSGLPSDWRQVRSRDASFDSFDTAPRFYLFTLKAYGYIQMRLRNFEEGRAAIAKVMELDPHDRLGGSVLMQVLNRAESGDEEA